MKVLIPSQYIELTGLVQRCLLIAEKEGFGIRHIELGVSPTQLFILSGESDPFHIRAVRHSEDLDFVDPSELLIPDLFIRYNSNLSVRESGDALHQADNMAIIGIGDESNFIDAWRLKSILSVFNGQLSSVIDEEGSIKAIKYQRTVDEFEWHLAWVITAKALDFPAEDCFVLARAALNSDVSRETWPSDYQDFPVPIIEDSRLLVSVGWASEGASISFEGVKKKSLGLYPVVDDVSWISRLLPLGIETIQLRIKDPHQLDLEQQIAESIQLGERYGAQVFINDHWKLAIKYGAYGVHLGQEDIQQSNLDLLAKAGLRLGLSTHGYYELLRIVQINPSYIALGHIFPTTTKKMPSKPQGLVRLSLYQSLIDTIPYSSGVTGYPTVAIGGIDQNTASSVWKCGVSSLAVVRAITEVDNPEAVIDSFTYLMQSRQFTDDRTQVDTLSESTLAVEVNNANG
ncbi:thiamine phosphate synthase [Vibrio genomosp. F10]|uniref:thiamine phosphate synthase n=1 Tax=Vibrio genomosp. F10 TaxID=723171 RepID=UPI0002FD9615|nr:thiamine phosphate synthase [Vibrio genomosp. F10]OEF07094.1 thiamine phosphate synthase [Vibrio genomosp. F10 str. 9ZB36]OEF08508.1 thiamine phosphate synthase [Vibrio genomosp. F10 str. 9ZD137]